MTHRPHLHYVLIAFLLVLFTSVIPVAAQTMPDVTATVSANVVALQSGPGLEYKAVGFAYLGNVFRVLGRARGSNRVWYQVVLPAGGTAWLSERIVNLNPGPDGLPWLGENAAKTPLVMDCGPLPPLLFAGAFAQVVSTGSVDLTNEAGVGKRKVGSAAPKTFVQVLDGPFCTLLSANSHQIQWFVVNQKGVGGFILESLTTGRNPLLKLSSAVTSADFAAVPTPTAQASDSAPRTVADSRPVGLSDADIQGVIDIFTGVQKKQLNQTDATARLQAFVDARSEAVLVWIVRHVPIYDGHKSAWYSFARYEDNSLMIFTIDSQLDVDPVETTIAILFGKYTESKAIFESIGCGGGGS